MSLDYAVPVLRRRRGGYVWSHKGCDCAFHRAIGVDSKLRHLFAVPAGAAVLAVTGTAMVGLVMLAPLALALLRAGWRNAGPVGPVMAALYKVAGGFRLDW